MLLQIDFSHAGPFGQEMAAMLGPLAEDIAKTNGLVWKIWTENEAAKTAGGIYMFDMETNARDYLTMHTKRLESFGITDVRARFFTINDALSLTTHWNPSIPQG